MQLDPNDTPDPAALAAELDAHGLLKARRGVAAGRRLHARLHPDPAGTDDAPGRGMDAGRDLYNRNHNHGGTR